VLRWLKLEKFGVGSTLNITALMTTLTAITIAGFDFDLVGKRVVKMVLRVLGDSVRVSIKGFDVPDGSVTVLQRQPFELCEVVDKDGKRVAGLHMEQVTLRVSTAELADWLQKRPARLACKGYSYLDLLQRISLPGTRDQGLCIQRDPSHQRPWYSEYPCDHGRAMACILEDVATKQTTIYHKMFRGPVACVDTDYRRGHIYSNVDALKGGYVEFAFTDGELEAEVARGARQMLLERFPNIVFADGRTLEDARTLALEGDNPYINHKYVARAVWLGPEIKEE
jgi:hypothetical protein